MTTRFKIWNRLQWKRQRKKWALGGSRGGRVKKKLKVGKDKSVIKGGQRPQEDDNGDAWDAGEGEAPGPQVQTCPDRSRLFAPSQHVLACLWRAY